MSDSEKALRFPDACVAMFARAPLKGKVKTRLIPALGEQGDLDLHMWLTQKQISVLNTGKLCRAELWVDQNPDDPVFNKFKGEIKLQRGENLGDRMAAAAQSVLGEFSAVLIIGSDCPDIDETYLEEALSVLFDGQTDVVLGPALDGGYVLIGMRQYHPELFQDIAWGTETVHRDTLLRIRNSSLTYAELPVLRDIDTAEDLKSLL